MVHYFNNTYKGKTPELFKIDLLLYLLKREIISSINEFIQIIENADIKDSGFNLLIKGDNHIFKPMPGGIYHQDYQTEVYILPENIAVNYLNS